MNLLAGQRVYVEYPLSSVSSIVPVVGVCSIVDDHGDTVSVLTQYEPRGARRFVKGVPRAAVSVLGPRAHHGAYGGGEDQRASGAIERLAGRMVAHGKSVASPMDANEAFDRARQVAGRNHR